MKAIGLDLGSKTLGIAVSDVLKMIASSYETLRFEEDNYEEALELFLKATAELEFDVIVLGLPKHMNGDIGYRGEISIYFKELIEEKLSVPVILWDERMTSIQANKVLIKADVSRKKRKQVVDKIAAVFILQSYLDAKR